MECIHGRRTYKLTHSALVALIDSHERVIIDLGTGDGRYVAHRARTCGADFVIGVDACREELRDTSRKAGTNALFVIANALALPPELDGLAAQITINFPWGSLLRSLIAADEVLLGGLRRIARPGATVEVHLNGGALAEAGTTLEQGGALVRSALQSAGFVVGALEQLDARALRACPTSWARRLAFGRDPRALALRGAWRERAADRREVEVSYRAAG